MRQFHGRSIGWQNIKSDVHCTSLKEIVDGPQDAGEEVMVCRYGIGVLELLDDFSMIAYGNRIRESLFIVGNINLIRQICFDS